MGKLNIAHHKSYHPYRQDNIEKVRKDEENAKLKEEQEEQRMMLAVSFPLAIMTLLYKQDSEARINALRQRAGIPSSSHSPIEDKDEDDALAMIHVQKSESTFNAITDAAGHINFFAEFDSALATQQSIKKKEKAKEEERGAPLAPSTHDLNPWYADRDLRSIKEKEREKDQNLMEERK
jgi:hypothetical protein